MQNSLVDFSEEDLRKGFRLYRLEVYNWGTFNRKVWKIEPDGFNSLLTGNIGSGKSTLVDAIITLLVPPRKIVYNKAAGAETRERDITSYVRGEYKNQKNEFGASVPVYLRDDTKYSVILARFNNKGFETGFTLAQIFTVRKKSVDRFFIISKDDLTIDRHFQLEADDRDISPLKKRLKSSDRNEVFESYNDYSEKFRKYFGIRSEKVMELFNQTVSMKSVGRLTDFMRDHMLEKFDVKEQIEGIRENYDNLTKSHEAIQRAKRQLDQLKPLNDEMLTYQNFHRSNQKIKRASDFIPAYFADKKIEILEKEIKGLDSEKEQLEHCNNDLEKELESLRSQELDTKVLIGQDKAGQRINQIDQEIARLEETKKVKKSKNVEYSSLCASLGFSDNPDQGLFQHVLQEAEKIELSIEMEIKSVESHNLQLSIRYTQLRDILQDHRSEFESLRGRKTKIPDINLQLRQKILTGLNLKDSDLPFIGELLQVKPEEKIWEGAIERVLRVFGLSILVGEKYYREVSSFIDKTDLRGRVVYYRVPESQFISNRKEIDAFSLVKKVEIKDDSVFFDWLSDEMRERFNYICCDSLERFQKEIKAITKNGQIKGIRGYHEKDDRENIRDPKNYVLGWNNQEKINRIKEDIALVEKQIEENQSDQKSILKKKEDLEARKFHVHDFVKIRDFQEINWKKVVEDIEKLKQELDNIRHSSNPLKTLKEQLESIQKKIQDAENEKNSCQNKLAMVGAKISGYQTDELRCKQIISEAVFDDVEELKSIISNDITNENLNAKSIDQVQDNTRKRLAKTIEKNYENENKSREKITSQMQKFKHDFPEDTGEIISTIDTIPEFQKLFEKIKGEDLPRYLDRFKDLLNERTIQDIVLFKSYLETNARQIEQKIKAINDSLKSIDYGDNSYIELLSEQIQDVDIKDFQNQLRDCLEGTLGDKNLYSEDKFNQVKKILDKFNSGNPVEIAWTNKVTDVRNWFEFSAAEKFRSDNTEKEYYSDSSGKSGGQKEKLAYTILASALAYQFGPAGNNPKSKSFRFVMIDEAFGRGSDDSTRYGLNLFRKLDLQLLIITPLQKINIIENYINCIHLVTNNENGNDSMSRDISIQEHLNSKLDNNPAVGQG